MIQRKFILLLFLLCNAFVVELLAQDVRIDSMAFNGKYVEIMITSDNDTIIIGSDFEEMVVSGNRYKTRKEAYHYDRMKRRALKVHLYAVDAVRIFKEVNVTPPFEKINI